jgi:DNA uptake protein ComE-like DNA-binding protein
MRARTRFAALAAMLLCGCLAGMAQYHYPYYRPFPKTSNKTANSEDRVDINRASLDALLKVPGMTRSWAERIVRFRPYHTKRDLLERGVVSSQVYSRIKDSIIAHKKKQ